MSRVPRGLGVGGARSGVLGEVYGAPLLIGGGTARPALNVPTIDGYLDQYQNAGAVRLSGRGLCYTLAKISATTTAWHFFSGPALPFRGLVRYLVFWMSGGPQNAVIYPFWSKDIVKGSFAVGAIPSVQWMLFGLDGLTGFIPGLSVGALNSPFYLPMNLVLPGIGFHLGIAMSLIAGANGTFCFEVLEVID